jgi:hypothetical protein
LRYQVPKEEICVDFEQILEPRQKNLQLARDWQFLRFARNWQFYICVRCGVDVWLWENIKGREEKEKSSARKGRFLVVGDVQSGG